MTAAARARAHLLAVAHEPRPAGGAGEARARTYCADALRDAGFAVREAPFEYSSAVGRWAMPAAGVVWVAAIVVASAFGAGARPDVALTVLAGALVAVVSGARWATRWGVSRFPFFRERAVNLVATRGSARPALWLVAHVDSKSQPVPMVARVVGVASTAALWAAAITLAGAQLAGWVDGAVWMPLALAGIVCAAPVVGSVIGAQSPGALDNGSGVATVLLAATDDDLDAPPLPVEVGVLLTSAEELGLGGAREWVRSRDEGAAVVAEAAAAARAPIALNVDGIDDRGTLRVMTASPLPAALSAALAREPLVRRLRRPAGVLVDAIALADGGFHALTVSRGTLATLARIHTRGDTVDVLHGDGIVEAARLVRRLAAACDERRGDRVLDHEPAAD